MSETLFLSGSNFQAGFTAGTFQIPSFISPGIPVGLAIPYLIRRPRTTDVFGSFDNITLTPNVKYFLNTTDFSTTYGTIVDIDNYNKMYKFDYSRVVGVRLSALSVATDVSVYISYYDCYGKIGVRKVVLSATSADFTNTIACLGIASIYLEASVQTEVSIRLIMQNIFELPITDNGMLSQLLYVSGANLLDDPEINRPWIATFNDAEPYGFQWDGNYSPANRITVPITLTSGKPRPWFEILNAGETFDDTIQRHSFVFQQNVYGLGNATQFNNPDPSYPKIDANTYDGRYVFGQHNYTEGFEPWKS